MNAVRLRLTARGLLRCPGCGSEIATPVAWNPWSGCEERTILVSGDAGRCPVCNVPHHIDGQTALLHNQHWHSHDPRFHHATAGQVEPEPTESLEIEYVRGSGANRQHVRISIRSQGRPILPGLLQGVLQLPGLGPEEVSLELDEG